ncbi:MAG: hypothetical protein KKE37_05420 [Verrucomicrobia bacterium]|nr:hypothetical protein [Verrucomicrobiota bacterium]MBU4289858.1 hypothetical protein [Verrucomicrobiota bacterium]MBU4428778.1 hypothetical protein [Verrucomicrobiota bacterium]
MIFLPKSPVKESVVYRFSVLKQNDTQIPSFRFRYPAPSPNPTVRLDKFGMRIFHHVLDPFITNTTAVRPLANVHEVLRELHGRNLPNPDVGVEHCVSATNNVLSNPICRE